MIKFKRNESFYIRDGWFQKAIHSIDESDVNVFSGINGVDELGIGSNMVKSLKYWLLSSNVIEKGTKRVELTAFGKQLLKKDPYLESSFSWFLIHYFLVTNFPDAPIFNLIFNFKLNRFSKNDVFKMIKEDLLERKVDVKESYILDDLNVFLKTYTVEDKEGDPEDNYICPLSTLRLLEKKQRDCYVLKRPHYGELSYLIVYFSLYNKYTKQFDIEEALSCKDSPTHIFNLDKNCFLQYLDEMKKNDLITINKTAGLNTVYLNVKMTIEELMERGFQN